MRSRIIRCLLVVSFFLAVSVYAQETTSVSYIVAKMKKELNLTQEQVDAVKPILAEDMAKRDELKQSLRDQVTISDSSAIQSKIGELDRDENKKLSMILTKDQMNKWIQKQNLKNIFNKDQTSNARWTPEDDKGATGVNF